MIRRPRRTLLVLAVLLLASSAAVYAQPQAQELNLKIDGVGTVSAPLQIVLVLTLLSFVPAALVMMTSFTRIAIVFHFLRQAIGTQEMPSNQMVVGLTLFLTAFIMAPVADRINTLAVQPAIGGYQHRLPGFEQVALATQELAEHRELEGAGLVGTLHEGEAIALG
mgnify:CR=1 FL=1